MTWKIKKCKLNEISTCSEGKNKEKNIYLTCNMMRMIITNRTIETNKKQIVDYVKIHDFTVIIK